jgi:hypothetical protein
MDETGFPHFSSSFYTHIPARLVLQRKVAPCAVPGARLSSQIAAGDGSFEPDFAL